MDGKIKQELLTNTEWEIMTPEGWSNFDGLMLTHNSELIEIELDGKTLKCTPDHKIFINDVDYVEAKTLNHRKIEGLHKVYDPVNVAKKNKYVSNDITSHNCVILDEFAFLPKTVADEFFTSIYPTISSGETTKMIVISTPKGLNHFYKMYTEAVNKENDYINLEIKWNDVPGRNEKFKEEQIKNFGLERWRQEFECVDGETEVTVLNNETGKIETIPISCLYIRD